MENKNINKNMNLNGGKEKLRYNDLLINKKKSYPTNSTKKNFDSNRRFQNALINLREGLAELSNEYFDEKSREKYNFSYKDISLKKLPYSNPKNNYLRSKTPKRNVEYPSSTNNIPLSYLNDSKLLNNTYIKSKRDFAIDNTGGLSSRFRPNLTMPGRKKADSEFNDVISLEKIYNININDYSKSKEIIMLNDILKKQNKEFRLKAGEMRNKINELLNNLKLIKMENHKLNNEKKNY